MRGRKGRKGRWREGEKEECGKEGRTDIQGGNRHSEEEETAVQSLGQQSPVCACAQALCPWRYKQSLSPLLLGGYLQTEGCGCVPGTGTSLSFLI